MNKFYFSSERKIFCLEEGKQIQKIAERPRPSKICFAGNKAFDLGIGGWPNEPRSLIYSTFDDPDGKKPIIDREGYIWKLFEYAGEIHYFCNFDSYYGYKKTESKLYSLSNSVNPIVTRGYGANGLVFNRELYDLNVDYDKGDCWTNKYKLCKTLEDKLGKNPLFIKRGRLQQIRLFTYGDSIYSIVNYYNLRKECGEIYDVIRDCKFKNPVVRRDSNIESLFEINGDFYDVSGKKIYKTFEDINGEKPVADRSGVSKRLSHSILKGGEVYLEKIIMVGYMGKIFDFCDFRILRMHLDECYFEIYDTLNDKNGERNIQNQEPLAFMLSKSDDLIHCVI